jgi:hypothetical protein
MKPSMTGRVHRPTLDEVELVDTVRSRLVQGHDRAQLPRQLHLLFGVDEAAVVRALAVVDDEARGAVRAEFGEYARVGAVAVVVGGVVSGLVGAFGARAFTALGFGAAAVAAVVVVAELLRRRG